MRLLQNLNSLELHKVLVVDDGFGASCQVHDHVVQTVAPVDVVKNHEIATAFIDMTFIERAFRREK